MYGDQSEEFVNGSWALRLNQHHIICNPGLGKVAWSSAQSE